VRVTLGPVRPTIVSTGPIVLLLAAAHLMAFVDRFAMSAVAGPVETAFKLSETDLGALQGLAIALPYALAVLPLGRLADRVSARALIILGLLVWTAGASGCALSTSTAELWVSRMLIGLGQAAFVPAALTLLSRSFPIATLSKPLSVFTAGATLGKSVALLASGAILASAPLMPAISGLFGHTPWREVFALTAAPNLLLILAFLVVRMPEPLAPAVAQTLSWRSAAVLLNAGFLSFALLALAPIVLIQATAVWTPIFFVRAFSLSPIAAAARLGGVVLVAAPLGHLIGGQLTSHVLRRGGEPGLVVAASLAAAIPLGGLFGAAPSAGLALWAYAALVVVLGIAAPAGLTGISRMAPAGRLALANAAYMGMATLLGVGLGPTLVGLLSDHVFGGEAGLRASLISLIIGVSGASMLLALRFQRRWRAPVLATGEAAAR